MINENNKEAQEHTSEQESVQPAKTSLHLKIDSEINELLKDTVKKIGIKKYVFVEQVLKQACEKAVKNNYKFTIK